MTLATDRERLYGLLEGLTGLTRKRDTRLEKIAADRALEARYTVGLVVDGNDGIPHPIEQLEARTFPLQGTYKGVWENAIWFYGKPDPIQEMANGWWNSAPHKANLMNLDATTWGLGLYVEPYNGVDRYYGICVFTKNLIGVPPPEPPYDWAGQLNPFGTLYPYYTHTSYDALMWIGRVIRNMKAAGTL